MRKIDKKLLNFVALSPSSCTLECIVYYNNRSRAMDFFKENNIKVLKDFPLISAVVVCFNSSNMLLAAREKCVSYISSVASVFALMDVSKKILNIDGSYLGKGITIAFIDTGINPHLDFTLKCSRIIEFCDFVNGCKREYDDNGHGTFVTGVACGSGIVSCGKYSGVAPEANIVSLKALSSIGEATAVTILEAMQWVFDNHKKYNIKVVCMSFGSEPVGREDPIMLGAEKLWQEGICVVSAGGNSGPLYQTIKSPGISRKIITVGGLDDNRDSIGNYSERMFKVAEFSSRGPAFGRIKPDFLAPSVNITSCSHLGGYKLMSGTSVATPMVAGMCALMYEKYPNISPNQIKKYLISHSRSISRQKYAQGYGVVRM